MTASGETVGVKRLRLAARRDHSHPLGVVHVQDADHVVVLEVTVGVLGRGFLWWEGCLVRSVLAVFSRNACKQKTTQHHTVPNG